MQVNGLPPLIQPTEETDVTPKQLIQSAILSKTDLSDTIDTLNRRWPELDYCFSGLPVAAVLNEPKWIDYFFQNGKDDGYLTECAADYNNQDLLLYSFGLSRAVHLRRCDWSYSGKTNQEMQALINRLIDDHSELPERAYKFLSSLDTSSYTAFLQDLEKRRDDPEYIAIMTPVDFEKAYEQLKEVKELLLGKEIAQLEKKKSSCQKASSLWKLVGWDRNTAISQIDQEIKESETKPFTIAAQIEPYKIRIEAKRRALLHRPTRVIFPSWRFDTISKHLFTGNARNAVENLSYYEAEICKDRLFKNLNALALKIDEIYQNNEDLEVQVDLKKLSQSLKGYIKLFSSK